MDVTNTFTHDKKIYSLDIVYKLVRSEKAIFMDTSKLNWILKYDTPQEDRVAKARLRWPLLVTMWRGKYVVIDGLHRLERCRRRGITVVPIKLVSAEILNKAYLHNEVKT